MSKPSFNPRPQNIVPITGATTGQLPSLDQMPYSQEAEEAVIGAVLVNPDAFSAVSTILKTDDFYLLRHRIIWQVFQRLCESGEKIDYLTVQEELRSLDSLNEIGGPAYLTRLMNSMPTSMHADVYARLVERAAIRRRLLAAADEIKTLAVNQDLNIETVIARTELAVLDITTAKTRQDVVSIQEGLSRYWDQIQENRQQLTGELLGLPTGLKDLDLTFKGLRRSKVYLFAGVSGHGKTDTALNVILNTALMGARVLFFSLDMAYDGIVNKMLSILTSIPHEEIESGRLTKAQWERYARAQARLEQCQLWISERSKGKDKESWDRLMSVAESINSRHGLDLIVIDYTLLISSGRPEIKPNSYDDKVYGVMNLPVLAQRFSVPVLALHQINKRRVLSPKKRPDDMEYLEYGGENAADVIVAWYKEFKYDPNADRSKLEAFVLKNRFGQDSVVLKFKHNGAIAKVTDWQDDALLASGLPTPPAPHFLDQLDDRAYGEGE